MENNYDRITVELLKSIRRHEAQSPLSQKLGYSFNQVGKWESGEKRLLWRELVRICEVRSIDLKAALEEAYFLFTDFTQPHKLMEELRGELQVSEFARRLGSNRLRVSRQLSGETEIPVADFFHALQVMKGNLVSFLQKLAPLDTMPSVREMAQSIIKEIHVSQNYPWSSALARVFELKEFSQRIPSIEELSRRFGFPYDELHTVIGTMVQTGLLVPNALGGYNTKNPSHYFTMGEDMHGNREYWAQLGAESVKALRGKINKFDENIFGFMTISVSEAGWEKVREAYHRFFFQVAQIVDGDDQSNLTKVKFASLQFGDMEMCAAARARMAERQYEGDGPKPGEGPSVAL